LALGEWSNREPVDPAFFVVRGDINEDGFESEFVS